MSNIATTTESTTNVVVAESTEKVATIAADVFRSANTLTARTNRLAKALGDMHAEYLTNGRSLGEYVKDARDLIAAVGDWSTVNVDIRKAVAGIAGTSGRLSSVMVADALGLSQSTASRVIRAAKQAEVKAAVADAKANGEDVETAKMAAENRANSVISAAGYEVAPTGGRNSKGSKSKGQRVVESVKSALESGDLSAADLKALRALLSK